MYVSSPSLQRRSGLTFTERSAPMAEKRPTTTPEAPPNGSGMKIRWDDSQMKSAYANVCNVSSTREEVVLMFGVNQAWQRGQAEVVIQLTDRLILSPFAAKRLSLLLQGVMREYETRFGDLPVEPPRAG
jgi:hypothetical protein